jgi:hypothetical protein
VVYEHSPDSRCHHPDHVSWGPSGWLWYMSSPLTQDATIRIMSQDAHQDDCGIWALIWLNMPPSGSRLKMHIRMIVVYDLSSDSICHHPDSVWRWQPYWLWREHYSDSRCHHPDPVPRCTSRWLWYLSTPLTQDAPIRILFQDAHQDDCGIWALLWLKMPPSGSYLYNRCTSGWLWLWAFLWLIMPPSGSCLKMTTILIVVYEHSPDSRCHHPDHVSWGPSGWLWYMSSPLTQYATIRIMSFDAHQDDCGIWALIWLNVPLSGSCLKMIVVNEHSFDSICHHPDPVSKWLW